MIQSNPFKNLYEAPFTFQDKPHLIGETSHKVNQMYSNNYSPTPTAYPWPTFTHKLHQNFYGHKT
jgi:hypothetical protein